MAEQPWHVATALAPRTAFWAAEERHQVLDIDVKVIKCRSQSNFNLNALRDTYDYSCFLARSTKYQHLMTVTSAPIAEPLLRQCWLQVHQLAPFAAAVALHPWKAWKVETFWEIVQTLGSRSLSPFLPARQCRQYILDKSQPRSCRPGGVTII